MKLALVVRTDLEMGRGKIAAQVAHAAVLALLTTGRTADCARWLEEGQPKVVLKVSGEDRLRQVVDAARAAGLASDVVRDAGRTQVPAGTPTCCFVGPAESGRIDAVTGELSLL